MLVSFYYFTDALTVEILSFRSDAKLFIANSHRRHNSRAVIKAYKIEQSQ